MLPQCRQLCIGILLSIIPVLANAQVSPIGALGSIQLLDNSGAPATSGCFYFFVAGTSTQASTFTDSSGSVLNPNPLCVGAGARAVAWLTTGAFYKITACLSNDGSFCSAGDVLWSQDQVPGGAQSSGGGASAPFISSSANPATSGVLRCASGDQCFAFRNAANSGNLAFTKDANDVFSLPSALKMPAVGQPSGLAAGFSHIWNDSTANRWKVSNNGAGPAQLVVSGNDISISDAVTALHFGATQTPIGSTPPTTGQCLQWNGTNLIAGGCENNENWSNGNGASCAGNVLFQGAGNNGCAVYWYWNNAHTITRLKVRLLLNGAGCTTLAIISIVDITSSSNLANITISNGTATFDSGALSITTTAGHDFAVGVTTASSGCSTTPGFSNFVVTYF